MYSGRYISPLLIIISIAVSTANVNGKAGEHKRLRMTLSASMTSSIRETAQKIVPGRSVGKLQLGDSRDQFFQVFRWKPNVDEDNSYPPGAGCLAREEKLHWLDTGSPPFASRSNVRLGVLAYLRNGRIFQIAVASPHFQTANGITEKSSPGSVKSRYSGLEAYWREHERAVPEGSRDSIYWVDEKRGIAFELVYFLDLHRRLVGSIFVFKPGTDFQPEGCVQYPQVWKKIAPYSLEPPVLKP